MGEIELLNLILVWWYILFGSPHDETDTETNFNSRLTKSKQSNTILIYLLFSAVAGI